MKTQINKRNVTRKESRDSSYPNLFKGIEAVKKQIECYKNGKEYDSGKAAIKYGV